MHVQAKIGLLPQYDDVYAQRNHFVDGHEGRHMMSNANFPKEGVDFLILTTPNLFA
jgi:hypothetical protein